MWLHPGIYSVMPVLLLYVVRDPKCRRSTGGEELWGKPNSSGYFRDDNSLIKGLVGSLVVNSGRAGIFGDSRLGKGFVASHVWTAVKGDTDGIGRASRSPWLNSFVPNLVWLPAQVSKLSDREGSFVQMFVQVLSTRLYRNTEVAPELETIVGRCWSLLPEPEGISDEAIPPMDKLNFFSPSPRFLRDRLEKILRAVELVDLAVKGKTPNTKLISRRYDAGLHLVDKTALLSRRRPSLSNCSARPRAATHPRGQHRGQ